MHTFSVLQLPSWATSGIRGDPGAVGGSIVELAVADMAGRRR